jgi:hypothetical protein
MGQKKSDSDKTIAGGLRLKKEVWEGIESLAKKDRRTFNNYVELVLENHILRKKAKED